MLIAIEITDAKFVSSEIDALAQNPNMSIQIDLWVKSPLGMTGIDGRRAGG